MFADLQMLVPGLSIVRIVSNRHSTGNLVWARTMYVTVKCLFICVFIYIRYNVLLFI